MNNTNVHQLVTEAALLAMTTQQPVEQVIADYTQHISKAFSDALCNAVSKEQANIQRRRYYLSQQNTDALDALAAEHNTTPSKMLDAVLSSLVLNTQSGS